MRFFELLNFQHAAVSVLVPLIFILVFGVGLYVLPMVSSGEKQEAEEEPYQFNDGISEGNEPFPMVMALIIAGTVLWALFYTLLYGLTDIRL